MGVKVREKITGSDEWWVFINHGGRRTSRKVGSEKAALEVAKKIEAKLILGESFLPEKKPSSPTLDVGQWLTVLKQQEGECVAKIVKADPPKSRLLQTFVKVPVLDVLHVGGVPLLITKHPFRYFVTAFLQPLFPSPTF